MILKEEGIPASVVINMVRRLLNFPYPQVCRHLVAAELLGALKENGCPVDGALISAVFSGRDDEAIALIEHRKVK